MSIAKHLNIPIANTILGNFNNGETRVEFKESVRGRHIIVVCSVASGNINDAIMEVKSILDCCRRSGVSKITVVMPYFPYARSDKRDGRVPINAAVLAEDLKNVNNLISLDLHAGQIQALIPEGFHNLYFINYMCQYLFDNYLVYIQKEEWNNHFVLVSPDAGGVKRVQAYAEKLGINYVTMNKKRDYSNPGTVANSSISGKPGDYQGKIAIVIDDMADTMGTMDAAVKTMAEYGIRKVILAVTHGVFSKDIAFDRMNENDHILQVIVSNSLPQEENFKKCPKIRVIDCGMMISRTIDGIQTGKSISKQFA